MNPDFRDFFELLLRHGVNFAVIGGVAYNHYAPPRATKDIDIWVEPSPENVARLTAAIGAFGFPVYRRERKRGKGDPAEIPLDSFQAAPRVKRRIPRETTEGIDSPGSILGRGREPWMRRSAPVWTSSRPLGYRRRLSPV